MRPSACGDGQRFKHISPHLASPRKITHPNLPFGKARMGCPTGENKRGLMTITEETLPMTSARYRLSTLSMTSAPT